MIYRDVLRGRYVARRRAPSPRGPKRTFTCPVISEVVVVRLRRGYFGATGEHVECDQRECQYADDNRPPCPAGLHMFVEEIRARLRQRARDVA